MKRNKNRPEVKSKRENKNKPEENVIKKTNKNWFRRLPLYIRILIILAAVVFVAGIAAGGFYFYLNSLNKTINSITTAEIEDLLAPIESPEEPVTIMVLGRDTRDAENDAGRADIIMLLHLSPENGTCSLLSIPRDCWVEIPGHGEDKINAAYAYGGEELMIKTINSFLGAEINHYVTLDFDGFVELIDAVGGVDITIERPMVDPKSGANFSAGNHHLTGEQALSYTRSRSTELGDIGRIQRQQELFKELISQKLNVKYLSSVPYYFNILVDNTRTDLDILTILKYSKAVLSFGYENFETSIIPSRSDWKEDGTISVQIPDKEESRAMWERIINGEPASRYNAEYSEVDEIGSSMTMNTEYKFEIKVKNTGAIEWNRNGDKPVYLSYHWIDFTSRKTVIFDGKRSILPEDGINVGDEVTFQLAVRSPSKQGEYILQIDLVQEGVTWFSFQGVPALEKYISVDVSYGAEYDDGGGTPNYLDCDEEFEVELKVKNDGFLTWESSGKERVALGTHWINRDTGEVFIWDGDRTLLPLDISHGEEAEVDVKLKAPNKPGRYILQYDMVHERVTWFSEKGVIPMEVNVDVGEIVDRAIASDTNVKIFNGNGMKGAAGEVRDYIENCGFRIYGLANAENFNFEDSLIIYNEGCKEKAEELSLAFDNLEIYEYNKKWSFYKTGADLILIVGKDYSDIMK